MNTNLESILSTQQANAQVLFGMGSKVFEGVEKLAELNLQVARTTLEEAAETAQAAMSAKDPQALIALQTSVLQAAPEKLTAYGRHVYAILSATTAELKKTIEATMAESQKSFVAAVDAAVKNAPAGSENVVALVKSAVAAANNAYDGVAKAASQAASAAEANFETVTASASKAAQAALADKKAA